MIWTLSRQGLDFTWNLETDAAQLHSMDGHRIWSGSLMPALLIQENGARRVLKATAAETALPDEGGEIPLKFGVEATGTLTLRATETGVYVDELRLLWIGEPLPIVSLYFGLSEIAQEGWTSPLGAELGRWWMDWQADGFCIPSAKGAPPQSFFRFWDLGNAQLPLGSFGPTGTPYAAAFPRPLYCGAMGGDSGWVVAGPGEVPAGALYLKIHSGAAAVEYQYREDLWGAPPEKERVWTSPLRLAWAVEAWEAYRLHFSGIPTEPADCRHQRNSWNTWSEYKLGIYDNRAFITALAREIRPDLITFDERWETCDSTGLIHRDRFPDLEGDADFSREHGMQVGLWQSVSWIADPAAVGLTEDDLLRGVDGRPARANWLVSPFMESHYVLDPSSERAREFIRQKVLRIVSELKVELLKMDFGYGVPGLDAAAPRDPALRGERLAYTLYALMADAAREANPDITLQCWGLSPLLRPVFNLLAMDDLGDAGTAEALGHRQWSVWAALAGQHGTALMPSGGYDWDQDDEVVLNTAILGCPGGLAPFNEQAGTAPARCLALRRAVGLWYRHTVQWRPLWLNSEIGRLGHDPLVRCWGRLEFYGGDDEVITALALRDGADRLADAAPVGGLEWCGRWALIAQGAGSIHTAARVACIPLDGGWLRLPEESVNTRVRAVIGFDEHPWEDWTHTRGSLHIDAAKLPDGFTGFILER